MPKEARIVLLVILTIRSALESSERKSRGNASREGANTAITHLANEQLRNLTSREKVSWKGQFCRDQATAVGNLEEKQKHLGHSDKISVRDAKHRTLSSRLGQSKIQSSVSVSKTFSLNAMWDK